MLSPAGNELSASGRQILSAIFDRFDDNKDGELTLAEFNNLRNAVGEPPIDGNTLGLILEAQGIPITDRSTLAKVLFVFDIPSF